MAKQEMQNFDYVGALDKTTVKVVKMEEEMKKSFIAYRAPFPTCGTV